VKRESKLERFFESWLWRSRLAVVVAVVGSVIVALGALYIATVDVLVLLGKLPRYADSALSTETRADLRGEVVTGMVKAVDGYLIAAIMLIFALGMYVMFVSRIEAAENSEAAPRLLRFSSLDDLKDRIAKMMLLVLVIEFFQSALKLSYGTPLDLLQLALGILMIAGALLLGGHHHLKRVMVKGTGDQGRGPRSVSERASDRQASGSP
jgi:uncharacterized membrane protein YqhA